MEVAARGPGGGPVTDPVTDDPDEGAPDERSRVRLNAALYAVALVCFGAAVFAGFTMVDAYDGAKGQVESDGFWDRTWSVVTDERAASAGSVAGSDLGPGRVQALSEASTQEQERAAAVLDAATKMSNAFLNIRHDDIEASVEAVRSLATGDFREQYDKSVESITKVTTRAKSIQTGEVVWAGISSIDEDSATVIVASQGSVSNRTTEFKAEPRNYRLLLELVLEDGRWLTRDLQFVS